MQPAARQRRPDFPADLAVGLAGAMLLLPAEAMAIADGGSETIAVAAALLAGLGLAIGLVLVVFEAIARACGDCPWLRAFVRALSSLVVTIPVARHLFEGAFAASLPGAAIAPFAVPLFGVAALVPALRLGEAFTRLRAHRAFLGVVLAFVTMATDIVNRHAKRSEYPDVHTLLLVAACIGGGLALRLLVSAIRGHGQRSMFAVVLPTIGALAVAVALPACMLLGLQSQAAKWAVATQGMHTRLLVRLGRGMFDLDSDDHSALLGGGTATMATPRSIPAHRKSPATTSTRTATASSATTRWSARSRASRKCSAKRWTRGEAVPRQASSSRARKR